MVCVTVTTSDFYCQLISKDHTGISSAPLLITITYLEYYFLINMTFKISTYFQKMRKTILGKDWESLNNIIHGHVLSSAVYVMFCSAFCGRK